jgi:hypothetical protein
MSRRPNSDRERTSGNPMPSPAEVAAIRKRLGINISDWTPGQWSEHMSQIRRCGLTLTELACPESTKENAE